MKKIVWATIVLNFIGSLALVNNVAASPTILSVSLMGKIDIKIKNDIGDEITVINAGSGGTYRLTKNATTTIKMESGDQLFVYEKGKKGRLLLTASPDIQSKLQLLSKL